MLDCMQTQITWTHPIAIGVYVYSALSLLTGLGVLWARHNILHPERDKLVQELPIIENQISEGYQQLKALNRQVDKGVEQIQDLFYIVNALFLPLLKTRVVGMLLNLLENRFEKQPGWAKLVIEKGTETVFNQIEEHIVIKKEETHKEAVHG